jgi:hypothetical protein
MFIYLVRVWHLLPYDDFFYQSTSVLPSSHDLDSSVWGL